MVAGQFARFEAYVYQLLTGGAYAHLYFVFLIIQFYLLFPLLLLLAKRKGVAPYLFLIGAALQWGYIYLNSEVIQYMDYIPNILHKRASLFPTYLAYYLLGATIGIYYPQLKKWFTTGGSPRFGIKSLLTYATYALWLVTGLYYVYMYYMGRANNVWYPAKMYDLLLFSFTILSCIVLLQLSYWIMTRGRTKSRSTSCAFRHSVIWCVFPASTCFAVLSKGSCRFGSEASFLLWWRFCHRAWHLMVNYSMAYEIPEMVVDCDRNSAEEGYSRVNLAGRTIGDDPWIREGGTFAGV